MGVLLRGSAGLQATTVGYNGGRANSERFESEFLRIV